MGETDAAFDRARVPLQVRALLADEATDRREGGVPSSLFGRRFPLVEREQGSKNEELLSRKKGRKEGRDEQGRKTAGVVERRVSFVFVQTQPLLRGLHPLPSLQLRE